MFPSAVFSAIFRFWAILEVIEVQLPTVFYYLAEAEMETRAVSAYLCLLSSWLQVKTNSLSCPFIRQEKKSAAICQLTS